MGTPVALVGSPVVVVDIVGTPVAVVDVVGMPVAVVDVVGTLVAVGGSTLHSAVAYMFHVSNE